MKKTQYKNCFEGNEKWYVDKMKLINEKIETYDCRHMSNTKWRKLFLVILKNINIVKQCEIVEFVFDNCGIHWINDMKLTINIDIIDEYLFEDYISERLAGGHNPISYREINYIEFRKYYHKDVSRPSPPHNKYDTVNAEQDLDEIKRIISATGKFYWEETEQYLRILGYS